MTFPTPEQMVEIVRPPNTGQVVAIARRILDQPHGQTQNHDTAGLARAYLSNALLDPAAWNLMLSALYECEEYFDNRADADGDSEGFTPNTEMRLLVEVREAIAKAGG